MRHFFAWFLFASIGCGLLSCSNGKGRTETNPEGTPESPSFSLTDFSSEYDSRKLVTWIHGPTTGKSATNHLRLTFIKKNGETVAPQRLPRFWPYMSIHGHGTPKNGNVIPTADPHVYEMSGFIFTMGGKWELEVRVSLEGKAYALSIPVHVPEA